MPNPCPELRKKKSSEGKGKKGKKETKSKGGDGSQGKSKTQAKAPIKPNIPQSSLDKELPAHPPTNVLSLTSKALPEIPTPPKYRPDQPPMIDEITINTLVKGAREIEKRWKECEKETPPNADMIGQLFLAWKLHYESMERIEISRRSSNKPLNAGEKRNMAFIYGLRETAERVQNLAKGSP